MGHAEAPEVAMDPSLSSVTLTSSCSAMLLRLTTHTPLEPPLRPETACTTSPTPPPLLESLATTLLLPMDGTACVGGPGNDEQHVCGQCGVLFDVSWPLGAHDF